MHGRDFLPAGKARVLQIICAGGGFYACPAMKSAGGLAAGVPLHRNLPRMPVTPRFCLCDVPGIFTFREDYSASVSSVDSSAFSSMVAPAFSRSMTFWMAAVSVR